MNEALQYHDSRVRELYNTLLSKGWYVSVEREVPYHKTSRLERMVGQTDVLTRDERRIIYWEVKTGKPSKALRKLKKQAQAWFSSKEPNPNLHTYFVSYNPRNEPRPVIGRFRRYHAND